MLLLRIVSGDTFINGALVACQACQKRMIAPQTSPFLRCFHCSSVVRPGTAADIAAPKPQPQPTQDPAAGQRTRQALPQHTTDRLEAAFQAAKAAEKDPKQQGSGLALSLSQAPHFKTLVNNLSSENTRNPHHDSISRDVSE